jgi:site-specific recombinase XerC
MQKMKSNKTNIEVRTSINLITGAGNNHVHPHNLRVSFVGLASYICRVLGDVLMTGYVTCRIIYKVSFDSYNLYMN